MVLGESPWPESVLQGMRHIYSLKCYPMGVLAVCIKLNTRPHHGPVYLLHKAWAESIVTFKVVGDLVAQPTR